jgi:LacI family transcriptional regulator
MSKQVRIIDVARASNTSPKTVSRVLNEDPKVSVETRKLVLHKIKELNYQVDILARSLRVGYDNVIGVVVQKIGDPFFAQIVEEIEREANKKGIGVIVGSSHGDFDRENTLVQNFKQRRVAGMVITAQDVNYKYMKDMNIPVVFIDRNPINFKGDVVRVDDFAGAETATNHLIKHGHKKIAFIGDELKIKTSNLRHEGYLKALSDHQYKIDPKLDRVSVSTPEEAFANTIDLLNLKDPPTAIFAAKSVLAVGVVQAIHKIDRKDIALISFDDFTLADTIEPAITILDHSPIAVGQAAIKRLLEKLENPHLEEMEEILGLSVIERGSGELRPKGKKK